MMKKKFFFCFHPVAMETADSIIVSKANKKKKEFNFSGPEKKQKRAFSQVLEILLFRASLRIMPCDRSIAQPGLRTKNEKLRKIHRQLQTSDDKTTGGTYVDEYSVSQTEITGSVLTSSPCNSRETRSLTMVKTRMETNPLPEKHIIIKTCSCKSNPSLYVFVFTLFFTIFWGRVRSILLTLVFFYSFPMWAGFLR